MVSSFYSHIQYNDNRLTISFLGTVNTVGGVVGNVGRGVGKTLSDASSGLENTAKGAGGSINDVTGAKSQPQKK